MLRTLVLIVSLILFAAPALAGYKECEYDNGKIVQSKLSGLKGMIVSHRRMKPDERIAKNCQYDVRWVTSTGLVYTIERMMAYEIKWPSQKPAFTTPEPEVINRPTGVENLDFGD